MTFTEDSDQSKEAEVWPASDASVVTETSPSERVYGDQMTFTEDSDQSKEAEVWPASDASVVTETSPSETEYGDQMTFTEDSDQSKEAEVGPASDASVVIETSPSERVYGDQMTFTEDSDQSKEAEVWPASDASVVTETSPSETEYSDKMKLTEDSDQRKEAEVGPASHVSVVTETSPSETDYSDQMTFTEDSDQSHKVEEGPSSDASVVTETSPSETGDETVFTIYIEEPEKSEHVQGDVLFAVNKCNSGFQLEQLEEYVSDSDCSSIVETATNRPISLHKVLKASADSTSDGSEEQASSRELPGIVIQAVTGSGKRDYTKKHCCFFCEKSISKIGRHLEKAHQDEPEIRELPPVSKNNSTSEIAKRKMVLSKYRNLGNFNHNISVLLKKKGIFYVGRRPPKEKGNSASSYLPCPYCLTFLVKSELWRHVKICSFKENKLTVSNAEELKKATDECVSSAEYILQGALGTEVYNSDNQEFIDHVVKRFHMDNVSLAVKSDKLLLIFGKMQLRKLGLQRACQVREKLRILGRVKIELRSLTGLESADMDSFITPSKFDICMKAVRNLSGESNEGSSTGSKTFKRPSLALKAGQLLKRIAVLKRGQAIRKLDLSEKDETDQFISLYKEEFSEVISSLAHHTLSERKYNKKVLLPLTKDLLKYMNYLESTTIESTRLFLDCPCSSHWNTLAEVTIARIILFNKRRASEGAKMLVSQFVGRPAYGKENEELVSTLQPIEKQLMKTMSLVEVVGKQYKRVPILLSQTMVEAIQALVDKRAEGGVRSCNPYVFAQGDSNFKRGSDCIRRTVQACELEFPERITSTKLRKYLATVSQVFNLSESELGELARHMGHELSVHRRFYRLQDDVIELAKVSRLLMSVEEGKAAQFAGCTLDDINLEDFEEVEEEDVGDDEDGVEVDFDPHLDAVENIVPSSHPSKESVVQDDVLDTDEDVVACAPASKKRVGSRYVNRTHSDYSMKC
ncbi:uncharacterized protein LOC132731915 [Ruditapes philippinarum]|uniref:uncharacterized protein LOC132731915 n=1 Tax=Ruditapes philippinarum TaxID=129788 RepID=UPI00295BC353|nr:uncharacterized protein LOC132731915 [Ruditapes philippinarum]